VSKPFWESATFRRAAVAVGCLVWALYHGYEPDQTIIDNITHNADTLIALVGTIGAIQGRFVAEGPLSLK